MANAEVFENILEGRVESWTCASSKPSFRYPHLLQLNFLPLAPILTQIVSSFDGSMMNNLQNVTAWEDFDSPKTVRLGTMSKGTTIGTLVSTPFVSYLCDYSGRKNALIGGCVIVVVGAII